MAKPALPNVAVYDLSGEDVYRLQPPSTVSRVSYAGTERLAIGRDGGAIRFDVRATYIRTEPQRQRSADARFVAELLPDGSFEDRVDNDPDFLTILNQPFAVQLDSATLRDLRQLQRAVPFSASSPFGGDGVLRGFLRPGAAGPIGGRPSVPVRFVASGPMTGGLPGRTEQMLSGSMHMDATAYYALDDGLLLALNATLTIDARLRAHAHPELLVPVQIVYRRSIRIANPQRAVGQTAKPGKRS